ncbi:MAG: AraC family transcriptional regulator [Ferruginibacter sp.]
MESSTFLPDKSVSLFVKNILVFEETNEQLDTLLPFFADGYPGLMFQQSRNGLLVHPHNKAMPPFFLYGQTIKPIELVLKGSYQLVVFQLYPFVLASFFNVNPQDLNDQCYNLEQLQNRQVAEMLSQLQADTSFKMKIEAITSFLFSSFKLKKDSLDFTVRQAVQMILDNKGQIAIQQLSSALHLTERTLQRRFIKDVGLSPKQFAQIIQFQLSLEQLTINDYEKLSDIVYTNGFADQSHFIKVFKAFTGKTPGRFQAKKT